MDEFEVVDAVEVACSPVLVPLRNKGYGSIEGLDDSELADPRELERQVFLQEWGPILALPIRHRKSAVQPAIDEDGSVDWGAFGTVDFERYSGGFDKTRYKADQLREQLRDVLITLDMVKERLPGRAKYLVLKYVNMGVLDFDHIANEDALAFVKLWRRAERIRAEIRQIEDARHRRAQEQWARLVG